MPLSAILFFSFLLHSWYSRWMLPSLVWSLLPFTTSSSPSHYQTRWWDIRLDMPPFSFLFFFFFFSWPDRLIRSLMRNEWVAIDRRIKRLHEKRVYWGYLQHSVCTNVADVNMRYVWVMSDQSLRFFNWSVSQCYNRRGIRAGLNCCAEFKGLVMCRYGVLT